MLTHKNLILPFLQGESQKGFPPNTLTHKSVSTHKVRIWRSCRFRNPSNLGERGTRKATLLLLRAKKIQTRKKKSLAILLGF